MTDRLSSEKYLIADYFQNGTAILLKSILLLHLKTHLVKLGQLYIKSYGLQSFPSNELYSGTEISLVRCFKASYSLLRVRLGSFHDAKRILQFRKTLLITTRSKGTSDSLSPGIISCLTRDTRGGGGEPILRGLGNIKRR